MTIFLFKRKPEKEVIDLLRAHVSLSISSIKLLNEYIDDKDNSKLQEITKLEKEGDDIRKKVIINLYEAFLPSMKKELTYSIEILDEVLDSIKHGALIYDLIIFELNKTIKEKCKLILNISLDMLNSMYSLIDVFENGGDFKKHIKNIKTGEEAIDDIHHEIYRYMVNMKIDSFWEGKLMSDFVDKITEISDYIENVSDEFQIIYLNYR
ncbi:TIGR00153 family protein [Methanothermococcus okinawensis]|uniref:TIGR00153 family protein n=1 Tax=Methanothermococcus okinawensis TaxID=155863 RepID=UPI00064F494E|nr:TIGR00153 family protein [Methanothermococcus okinawensis]